MPAISRKGILILIITLFGVSSVSGQECFAPSPTSQGDKKYPPIITRELTKTEYRDLRKLFESMVGDLSGTGKEILCKGSTSNPAREIVRSTVRGEAALDHFGNFSLSAELYSAERNVSSSERIDLYLTTKTFRADSSNSSGDVELLEVSANRLRFRKRAAIGGSYPYGTVSQGEMIATISRENKNFTFIRSYYFQGLHSGTKEWHLIGGHP